MTKDQKQYCQEIYHKWETLAQEIDFNNLSLVTGGEYDEGDDVPANLKEYLNITNELSKECKNLLTPQQALEIEEKEDLL
jgi:hypothetical protein